MKLRRIYNTAVSIIFVFIAVSCSEDEGVVVTGDCVAFGTVVDGLTNEPLQGASVTLYPSGRTVVTGASGQYEFRGLQSGGYLLQVSRADYLSNTQSVVFNESSNSIQSDVTLSLGAHCLDVLVGELFFGDNVILKTFVVSNVGEETITWNLYTDYSNILNFDMDSGVLEPGQSQAVEVRMNRVLTNAGLTSFPIYVYANGEDVGVIATIDRKTAGLNTSLLVGEWELVYAEFIDNDEIWYNQYEESPYVFNIRSDYTVEKCQRGFVGNDYVDDLDATSIYAYEKYDYDYDPVRNSLILDPDMGLGSQYYRINILTESVLEIEAVDLIGTSRWNLQRFKRR